MHRLAGLGDDRHILAAVEHAVARAAVADAAAEELFLARQQARLRSAGTEDDALGLDKIRVEGQRKCIPHRDNLVHNAGHGLSAHFDSLIAHGAKQLLTGYAGHAGIVVDHFRAG